MKKIKLALILLLIIFAVHNLRATSDESHGGGKEHNAVSIGHGEEGKEHGAEGIAHSAEGEGGHGETHGIEHKPAHAGHQPSAHGKEHHAETPLVYYLIWAGLAVIGVIVLNGIRAIRKEKKKSHGEIHSANGIEHGAKGMEHGEGHEAGDEQGAMSHELSHDAGHKKHKSNLIPLILVVISFAIFFIEQLPALFGKVDIGQAKLVYGFHEDLFIGSLKLFTKIILGVLLVSYSILGMEEHH